MIMSARWITVLLAFAVAASAFGADGTGDLAAVPQYSSTTSPAQTVRPQWSTGTYAYDPSGNVKSIGTDAIRHVYQYDSVARVIEGNVKGEGQSFSYDPYGNLLKVGGEELCVEEATNHLCGSYRYDAIGNLTADKAGRRFYYDAAGMVVAIDVAITDTVLSDMRAIYTADDERIMISQGTTDRYRLRDHRNRVLREWKDTGGPLEWSRDYIYGGDTLVAGEVRADQTLNPLRHYHVDHQGSTRVVTDGTGTLVSSHDYLPFGSELASAILSTPRDPLKFTGHERDSFSAENVHGENLDYMHARYYSPGAARFMTVDPVLDSKRALTEPQRWNRYAYVINNPVNRVDPDGRRDRRDARDRAILEDPDVLADVATIVQRTRFDRPLPQRTEHGAIITDLGGGAYGTDGVVTSGSPTHVDFTIAANGRTTTSGQTIAGTIHSHPGRGRIGNLQVLAHRSSPGDRNVARTTASPVYILNERRSLIKFDPATGRDTHILTRRDFQQFLQRAELARQAELMVQAFQNFRLP
jgi:RHS repeat-associated protein